MNNNTDDIRVDKRTSKQDTSCLSACHSSTHLPVSRIRPGSPKAWFLAARPKTLSGALIPVVMACALAWRDGTFRRVPAMYCVIFAILMQIAANFINDLYDFKRGTDGSSRLGPERACAQGWISERSMRRGIALVLAMACFFGVALVVSSGAWIDFAYDFMTINWEPVLWLVAIGVACIVFAFLYTTLLSYVGGGDMLVYVFFGLIPVLGTYYTQALRLTADAWWLAASCGLVIDTLLILNNYRDRDTDRASGKRTLVALLGERFGSLSYLAHGVLAVALSCIPVCTGGIHDAWRALFPAIYLIPHVITWRSMTAIRRGRELNRILGQTSRNMLIFAALVCLALVV